MRSSLLSLMLLLSTAAFAADTPPPAGDTPSAETKAEAKARTVLKGLK